MTPEDVPTEWIDLAMTGAAPGCRMDAAFYLANTIPAIKAAARAEVAAEIRQVSKAQGLQPFDRSQLAVRQAMRAAYGVAATVAEDGPDDYLPAASAPSASPAAPVPPVTPSQGGSEGEDRGGLPGGAQSPSAPHASTPNGDSTVLDRLGAESEDGELAGEVR